MQTSTSGYAAPLALAAALLYQCAAAVSFIKLQVNLVAATTRYAASFYHLGGTVSFFIACLTSHPVS